MATFALSHGAGDGGWYWHLVGAELRERGHDVVAPDLPADDDAAGLPVYADAVLDAIGDRVRPVVVGQSFGAFTAPLVCDRLPAGLLVLVAPMIPSPGEPPGDWWKNTGYEREFHAGDDDVIATYYHDVPPGLATEALRRERNHPSARSGREPWPLRAWPDVPTRVLLCREDRLFPATFLRRVAQERLGFVPDEIDAGHCVALGHPKELAGRLEDYAAEATFQR
ncbi:MAG: alpha/beta fold hydrolase [Actinomycetota bacterium]